MEKNSPSNDWQVSLSDLEDLVHTYDYRLAESGHQVECITNTGDTIGHAYLPARTKDDLKAAMENLLTLPYENTTEWRSISPLSVVSLRIKKRITLEDTSAERS